MCLTREGYKRYCRRARNLDDEKLLQLDAHYRQNYLHNTTNTAERQLHIIVLQEISARRIFRQQQLERCLWLSTRRGRALEAIERWLIRHGLWSSSQHQRPQPHREDLLVVFVRLLLRLVRPRKHRATISSMRGRRASVERF